jgi:hypothetical protein
LGNDVDAIFFLLDHLLKTAHLAFNELKPSNNFSFYVVGGNWAFIGNTVTATNDLSVYNGIPTFPTATTTIGALDSRRSRRPTMPSRVTRSTCRLPYWQVYVARESSIRRASCLTWATV